MKRILNPTVALLLFLAGCGNDTILSSSPTDGNASKPTPDAPGTTDRGTYFPIQVGMAWTYGEEGPVIRVTDRVETLSGWGYVLEGLLENRIVRKDADGKIRELRGREWRVLLDLGAEGKTSWTIEASGDGSDLLDGTVVTVASRSEVLRVPYGRFEKSVHLTMRPRPGLADAGIMDMWFVPDLGLVKWSESWIGGVREWELTAFETTK